jgi:uncharacterized protein (TIGR03437 family)
MTSRICVPLLALAVSAVAQTVTYSEHIAPIIHAQCTTCHRTGEVAPFPLVTYADAVAQGRSIAAVTKSRYMPPWRAEPGWIAYKDERRLTDTQIALIQSWVAQGMPQGNPNLEPPLPAYPVGWELGTPDLILEIDQGFPVPADGSDIYRNLVLPTHVAEDKWVRALEVRPSARAVVHHALIYADTTQRGRAQDGKDGLPGFPGVGTVFTTVDPRQAVTGGLGFWVPGARAEFLPNGLAYELPRDSDLLLQMHFHPNGTAQVEKTRIGLYFGPKPDRSIMEVQAPPAFGIRTGLSIPAGASSHLLRGSFTLPVTLDAVRVSAHAHYLGKQAKLTATLPDGQVRVLLWIKEWDIDWQQQYTFAEPLTLPAGTRLDGELIYDNSENNPNNPSSPPRRVTWGEQSTDEMGSLILTVVPRTANDFSVTQGAIISSVLFAPDPVGTKPYFVSAGVVNGASGVPRAVSPGEIVVLYGDRLGPATLTSARPGADGRLPTTLSGTQVTFNGTPAPLVYTSARQVAVVAPFSIDGAPGAQVRLRNGTNESEPVPLPVAAANPGVFSLDYSGSGQAVAYNEDGTANSSTNAAARNSVVAIYATGAGQTTAAGIDGDTSAAAITAQPKLPLKLFIGGAQAGITAIAGAAGQAPGVWKISAKIPATVTPGAALIDLQVGALHSQPGMTLAVRQ